jgi:hypothetical protein
MKNLKISNGMIVEVRDFRQVVFEKALAKTAEQWVITKSNAHKDLAKLQQNIQLEISLLMMSQKILL